MYFFLAICAGGLFVANVSPGWLRTQDFATLGAVVVFCILGLVDQMKR